MSLQLPQLPKLLVLPPVLKRDVKCECCPAAQSPVCTGRQLDVRRELSPGDDLSGGRHSCCGMGLCFPVVATWSDFLLIARTG